MATVTFDGDSPDEGAVVATADPPKQRRTKRGAAPETPAAPDAKPAAKAPMACERCSKASGKAVACVPDTDRPGWMTCPNFCGFRYKPFSALKAAQRARAIRLDRSAR